MMIDLNYTECQKVQWHEKFMDDKTALDDDNLDDQLKETVFCVLEDGCSGGDVSI